MAKTQAVYKIMARPSESNVALPVSDWRFAEDNESLSNTYETNRHHYVTFQNRDRAVEVMKRIDKIFAPYKIYLRKEDPNAIKLFVR